MMQIAHVVPHVHREASGPSHSVTGICCGLTERGHDVRLHILGPLPQRSFPFVVEAHGQWRLLGRLGISPAMRRALMREAVEVDILHSHGLWMMPNTYPARATRHGSARLVVSPRGTLDPAALGVSRRRKRIAWRLGQERALRTANLLHATSEHEFDTIRSLGLKTPVAVIPNGVDIPTLTALDFESKPRIALYLGRLHPLKNLEALITAWARVESSAAREWELHIVGPEDRPGYENRLRTLAGAVDASGVHFEGPAYGDAKSQWYRRAELLILPTRTENFGMVVAEALAHAVPVIATKGAPWGAVLEKRCGWWVDHGEESLVAAFEEALIASPEALLAMGDRGRVWMNESFSWASVSRQMEEAYLWLLGGGDRPASVDIA